MNPIPEIAVSAWGRPVGTLTDGDAGTTFRYSPEMLDAGVSFSPLNHPAIGTAYSGSRVRGMYGLPSFIADSLPDSFGRRVMQTFFESKGLTNPSPLQLLSLVGNRGMGALDYEPSTPWEEEVEGAISAIQLERAARDAVEIFDQLNAGRVDPLLLREGSSIGGARPKMRLCIAPDGTLHDCANPPPGSTWHILKFDAHNHGWGAVEYAYSLMAVAAGIEMPETGIREVVAGDATLRCFIIRRFDIVDGIRHHYSSVSGLLNRPLYASQDGETPNDYRDIHALFRRMARAGHPLGDARGQLFRRCVFNFAAHNVDDHFKNFGLLMDPQGRWSFSPAFDLCYTDPGEEWVLAGGRCTGLYGTFRNITRADFEKFGRELLLPGPGIADGIDRTLDAIGDWPIYAKKAGVPATLEKPIGLTLGNLRRSFGSAVAKKTRAKKP